VMEAHAGEVEPLDGALVVIAADHLAVGHLLAQAVLVHAAVTLAVLSVLLAPGALPSGFVCAARARGGLVALLVVVPGFPRRDGSGRRGHQRRRRARHGRRRGDVALRDVLGGEETLRVPVDLSRSVLDQLHLEGGTFLHMCFSLTYR
uniref:Uncharacterized protein n=1 Tax=Salarias fasciatus TaxID=181472 RepID=A0A672GV18_SALFA